MNEKPDPLRDMVETLVHDELTDRARTLILAALLLKILERIEKLENE